MCPAVIFANKRTIKANGLVNIPIISTGHMIKYNGVGTGGAKMCPQYALFALKVVIKNVINAITKVK